MPVAGLEDADECLYTVDVLERAREDAIVARLVISDDP